jgi:hypothetical protein
MTVDPANANELAEIAGEVGADVLEGDLSYPSETGSWQLGDVDLGEYLDRYRGKSLVLIIASVGDAPSPNYTCGICGFVMNEVGECPRCKLQAIEFESELLERRRADLLELEQRMTLVPELTLVGRANIERGNIGYTDGNDRTKR